MLSTSKTLFSRLQENVSTPQREHDHDNQNPSSQRNLSLSLPSPTNNAPSAITIINSPHTQTSSNQSRSCTKSKDLCCPTKTITPCCLSRRAHRCQLTPTRPHKPVTILPPATQSTLSRHYRGRCEVEEVAPHHHQVKPSLLLYFHPPVPSS